jgi:hypothetical protein
MKFANALKFHRKSGEGLGLNPEDETSAGGAALASSQDVFWIVRYAGLFQ